MAAAEAKAEDEARMARQMIELLRNKLDDDLRAKIVDINKRTDFEEMNLRMQLEKIQEE